ncbi:MAG: ATP-dependent DNA helicase [Candidatus Fermentibacterota bacterium]
MRDERRLALRVGDLLAGDLSSAVPGYTARQSQIRMAEIVADAVEDGGLYLLEAGTGVGKSLAYLLPAVLHPGRTIVSTATISLQDQLIGKDIPAAVTVGGSPRTVALLKGRRNYLCRRKWEQRAGTLDLPDHLAAWAETTETGDRGELSRVPPYSVWAGISSDRLDCLGGSCPHSGSCHYLRARRRAAEADLVVVNHHLLLSGLAGADIIPESDILVADEAHKLEDAAGGCLGLTLGEGAVLPAYDEIAFSDIKTALKAEILERLRALASRLGELAGDAEGDEPWDPAEHVDILRDLEESAAALAETCEETDCLPSSVQVLDTVAQSCRELMGLAPEDWCVYVESAGRGSRVRAVPIEPGGYLRSLVYERFGTVVLTSATLSAAGSFDYFCGRLGASGAYVESLGSPFDYPSQGTLTIPGNLPSQDDHRELSRRVWELTRRLAGELGGRTMALFTSYRNLQLVRTMARTGMPEGLSLHVQGEVPRRAILEGFRRDPSGIILGTASFWEGVDLPGSLLRALVIDRIPFQSPGHPLVRARMDRIESRGGSSFMEYMLPGAVLRMKQGVGRLIRSRRDSGAVFLMDRRLVSSRYGGIILDSLPGFSRAGEEEAIEILLERGGGS